MTHGALMVEHKKSVFKFPQIMLCACIVGDSSKVTVEPSADLNGVDNVLNSRTMYRNTLQCILRRSHLTATHSP